LRHYESLTKMVLVTLGMLALPVQVRLVTMIAQSSAAEKRPKHRIVEYREEAAHCAPRYTPGQNEAQPTAATVKLYALALSGWIRPVTVTALTPAASKKPKRKTEEN
jgi:hypothetical protein